MTTLLSRVENYWNKRAHDFNTIRRNELQSEISQRWLNVFHQYLPANKTLKILDIGTGTGYFSILLSKEGHDVTGIDLTEAMVKEAEATAHDYNVSPTFIQMDAQATSFANNTFDVIVTRNLTWTLPNPQKESYISSSDVYGHLGITAELEKENDDITLSMPCSMHHRPEWDIELIKKGGFAEYFTDKNLGKKVLREHDLTDAPLFLIYAKKS